MIALDERNEWREQLKAGIIPDAVRMQVELYRSKRDNPDWRATRIVETLGEAACVLVDQIDNPSYHHWFLTALDLDREGKLDKSLDVLFQHVDQMMHAGKFSEIDNMLRFMQHIDCTVNFAIGVLTITFHGKKNLLNRHDYYLRLKQDFQHFPDADALLYGLE